MTESISVQNEQIREKAAILFDQFKEKLKLEIPAGMEEDQYMICQEMIFYACEHGVPASSSVVLEEKDDTHLSQLELIRFSEELYLIGFIFWGNTDDRITPFSYLDSRLKSAYLDIALSICEWYKKGELPHAEKSSPQSPNGEDSK